MAKDALKPKVLKNIIKEEYLYSIDYIEIQ